MKHSLPDKHIQLLYLEPYSFSVITGNNVLIYNSLNGIILEYKNSPSITRIVRKAEDPATGFLAEINTHSTSAEVSSFLLDMKESFSGDVISSDIKQKPLVIRPKPIIKNHPPAKDFPSFAADDYLRNIYFFLNQDNNELCHNYKDAAAQFFCPVYNSQGYLEMPAGTVFNSCSFLTGVSGIRLDFSGSDLTRYSQTDDLLKQLRKLSLAVTFHIPLPCYNENMVWKLLTVGNSRLAFYITFPHGPSALTDLMKNAEFKKKLKRIDTNVVIQSLDEYQLMAELLPVNTQQKVFFLPYFNGKNAEFFTENVFLSKNEILNLKPTQMQIYSRMLINEHLFGKLFIKTNGEACTNINQSSIGNINQDTISNLVRNELYNGTIWHLTRMKVKPCRECLYQIFCPPLGNYELFMGRFNFCDVR